MSVYLSLFLSIFLIACAGGSTPPPTPPVQRPEGCPVGQKRIGDWCWPEGAQPESRPILPCNRPKIYLASLGEVPPATPMSCSHELVATNTRYSKCCLERNEKGVCTRNGQIACTDWRCKLCGHEPDATCTGCAP